MLKSIYQEKTLNWKEKEQIQNDASYNLTELEGTKIYYLMKIKKLNDISKMAYDYEVEDNLCLTLYGVDLLGLIQLGMELLLTIFSYEMYRDL